ncbi:hypothetical protein C1645_389349 [Glomus cerebriforme]|uniref:Uncharacterized protein n=1 Tax=Glomus cerebriforme TaxID=658196 RepID=A0A397TDQ1_9GLOM|nr:hypothetical protein C1645_389349 [Glomus cerebriforme]
MTDSSQKSSSSRRLSSSSASSTLSGQLTRHRSQHGNSSGNSAINNLPSVPDIPAWLTQPPVRNSTSSSSQQSQQVTSRIGSSPHKKSHSLTKTSRDGKTEITTMLDLLDPNMTSTSSVSSSQRKLSHKQLKEESKHESTNSSESLPSSKQSKKAKYKAATEEALKQFNDLQMVEHKLASQTNEIMARVQNLFQPNMNDEEAFGDDSLGKNGLGNDKQRRTPSASKRTISTPATPIKLSTTRRASQETERPTKTSSSASGIDRQRTRTIDSSTLSILKSHHSRYASENTISTSTEKKSLKPARSEEKIRSAAEKQKKIEKRKTIDSSIKTIAIEQLDKFNVQDFNSKRKNTIDNSSLSIDLDFGNDSHQYGQTPSPLWPGVSKSKTMPITPPPSTLTSKLPPPMPVRSSSYSSVGHASISKNIQGMEADNNISTNLIENTSSSGVSVKRRKSKVDSATSGSPNSSISSTKTTSSRTTTPTTIASHRLSHPPPLKDGQPPPPVPTMPSMLPQPKLTRVNEEIPPVPAIPSSINSEKKVSISASCIKNSGDVSPHGRKNNKSTDGHRPPSSSIKKKNRPRGTVREIILRFNSIVLV